VRAARHARDLIAPGVCDNPGRMPFPNAAGAAAFPAPDGHGMAGAGAAAFPAPAGPGITGAMDAGMAGAADAGPAIPGAGAFWPNTTVHPLHPLQPAHRHEHRIGDVCGTMSLIVGGLSAAMMRV